MRSALPLVLFLAVFGGGCLYLDLAHHLLFVWPWAFLLLLVTPWIWWMHQASYSGLTPVRSVLSLLVRLFVVGVVILLLADPRSVRQNDVLTVMYALDISDSISEKMSNLGLKYVADTVTGRPEKDEVGLVVFGRDAAVEMPPRTTLPLEGIEAINSRIGKDATNIEKALSLSAAMIPEEHRGRIVLLTDGVQTEGNISPVLDELKAQRIPVDVVPTQYEFPDEVWLERLDLPRFVKTGETYEASVLINSLQPGAGKLTLRENGQVIASEPVEFGAGKTRKTFPLYLRQPGYYEYVATIEVPPGKDGWTENNTAINFLFIKGQGKVLVVTDSQGQPDDWKSLVNALRESKRAVETCTSYEFPRDALSLMPYDCVVFVNVAADAFDPVQLQAVHDAVYNLGTGFLMVGGKNSFGPGGYHLTPVEEALPVSMDITQKKVLPKGALVIILHTCEFAQGNTWAKRITKEALRVLSPQDEFGVLFYANGAQWLFPLTPASDYDRIVTLINSAEPGDMPDFTSTMQMGLAGLKASDAATKHMVIISDGDPSAPAPTLLSDFVANKITVSTIAIFPHDRTNGSLLELIANATGGRFYLPEDPNLLPSIFIKEAKTLRRSMIQNKTFTPLLNFPSAIMKGIDTMPELHGYVLVTAKSPQREENRNSAQSEQEGTSSENTSLGAQTILKTPEKEELEPVLATWHFGLGKSAAFTSDLSPNWGAAWVTWDRYKAFVDQLIKDISRVEQLSHLNMRTYTEGNSGVIEMEDFDPQDTFLDTQATVAGPGERSETVALKQVAPRRYQAEFPLWGRGRYQVIGVGMGGGRSERATGGFVVPYSPEYLRFRYNPLVLQQIAQRTGGRVLSGEEKAKDIFLRDGEPKRSSQPVSDWFLFFLAFLIPFDVALRRIQIDWYVIRGWLRLDRKHKVEGTLDVLLRRKEQIEYVPGQRGKAGEKAGQTAAPSATIKGAPGAPPVAPPPPKGGSGGTTMDRLLEARKKWKKN